MIKDNDLILTITAILILVSVLALVATAIALFAGGSLSGAELLVPVLVSCAVSLIISIGLFRTYLPNK